MKVLSTTSVALRERQSAATASMSVSVRIGLVGVSTKTMRVSGVMAASICLMSEVSTKENVSEKFFRTPLMRRKVPP